MTQCGQESCGRAARENFLLRGTWARRTSQTTVSNHGQHRSLQYIAWRLPAYAPGHPCCRGGPWSWPPNSASGTLWLSTACVCAIAVLITSPLALPAQGCMQLPAALCSSSSKPVAPALSSAPTMQPAAIKCIHPWKVSFCGWHMCDAFACGAAQQLHNHRFRVCVGAKSEQAQQYTPKTIAWEFAYHAAVLRSAMLSCLARIFACSRPCSLLPWLAQRALDARRLGPSPGLAAVEPLPPPLTTASCTTALCWRGWTPRRRQSEQSERSAQKAKRMNAVAPSPTLAIGYS